MSCLNLLVMRKSIDSSFGSGRSIVCFDVIPLLLGMMTSMGCCSNIFEPFGMWVTLLQLWDTPVLVTDKALLLLKLGMLWAKFFLSDGVHKRIERICNIIYFIACVAMNCLFCPFKSCISEISHEISLILPVGDGCIGFMTYLILHIGLASVLLLSGSTMGPAADVVFLILQIFVCDAFGFYSIISREYIFITFF